MVISYHVLTKSTVKNYRRIQVCSSLWSNNSEAQLSAFIHKFEYMCHIVILEKIFFLMLWLCYIIAASWWSGNIWEIAGKFSCCLCFLFGSGIWNECFLLVWRREGERTLIGEWDRRPTMPSGEFHPRKYVWLGNGYYQISITSSS